MKFKLDRVKTDSFVIGAEADFETSSDRHDDFAQMATELAEVKQALQFALEMAQFVAAPVYEDIVDEAFTDLEEYLP
jgi:hypothetical protein